MKTKSPPLAERKKVPKPYLHDCGYVEVIQNGFKHWPHVTELRISFPTASAAKRRLKWELMSEEQKVEAITLKVTVIDSPEDIARAVLHLLEGERK